MLMLMLIAIHPTEHHRNLKFEGRSQITSIASRVTETHQLLSKNPLVRSRPGSDHPGALVCTPSSLYMKEDRCFPAELNYLYFSVVFILVFSSVSVVPDSTRSCFRGEGGEASSGGVGAGWGTGGRTWSYGRYR